MTMSTGTRSAFFLSVAHLSRSPMSPPSSLPPIRIGGVAGGVFLFAASSLSDPHAARMTKAIEIERVVILRMSASAVQVAAALVGPDADASTAGVLHARAGP